MLLFLTIFQNVISSVSKKFQHISGLITFMVLGYIAGTANAAHNADYSLYLASYQMHLGNFEKGYTYVSNLASASGLTYEQFRLISSIIVYLILYIAICRYTKNISTVAILYTFIIFPLDAIQVRNGMMLAIVALGISFLQKDCWKNYILSFMLIYFASLFHSLGLVFLTVPLLVLVLRHKRIFVLYHAELIALVLSVFFRIVGGSVIQSLSLKVASTFGSRGTLSNNLSSVYTNSTKVNVWLIFFVIAILFSLLPFLFQKYISNADGLIQEDYVATSWVMFFFGVSLILMVISVDYVRIMRVASFFAIILVARMFSNELKKRSFTVNVIVFIAFLFAGILLMYAQIKGVYRVQNELPYIYKIISQN
ncbi:EpsG family protein [Lactiplantibacillus plantarum]|uniref:EpsG family protein n=1 Tax=Lactiplantibacillus plantarum TaxID=1590 RepID=UPI001CFDFDEE|nr:EpsG family protein [Lactiplantibacillus plantarum]GJI54866.1 EpsG family protein [Lactiplantibacillus plantarum]